jgi:hypothetical protein
MGRATTKALWIATGAIGILLVGFPILLFLGSVVLDDPADEVAFATIAAGDGTTQPMHRIPGSMFVAIPRIEGDIAIHCRDGSVEHAGYATPHMHVRVSAQGACGIAAR